MTEGWIGRLIQEKAELEDRVLKLEKFLDSEEFKNLHKTLRELLISQKKHMDGYLNVLRARIELSKVRDGLSSLPQDNV